ncbi:MAG: peptide chain release factor-like protein [Gemmatimonadetes bacterium]|nr:peptide chain release factor-like protein [Gemmatimonadota bacterium]NNF15079.1 peptide chain release factor-like protein [Gemmatimonadota bacterium]
MTESNESAGEDAAEAPVVIPEDDEALLAECRMETFRSGGPGGQHQNTTESGVRLVHLPTGERVEARDERSQYRNRRLALARLRARLEARNEVPAERIPTKVPKSQKRKRLEKKRRRSRKKKLRKPPDVDE